jgi:hypothetical protein
MSPETVLGAGYAVALLANFPVPLASDGLHIGPDGTRPRSRWASENRAVARADLHMEESEELPLPAARTDNVSAS